MMHALSALVLLGGMTAGAEDQPVVSQGMQLEERVLAERQKIKHGRVRISVRNSLGRSLDEAGTDVNTFFYDIEFDGDRIRVVNSPSGVIRIVTESEVADSRKDRTDLLDAHIAGPAKREDVFYPRLFGLAVSPIQALDNFNDEQMLAFADRKNETIVEEDLNGIPVHHVSYERLVGNRIELWIARDEGYRLVKGMAQTDAGSDTINVSWELYKPGAWFPKTVAFRQLLNDHVTIDEIATVESADFNVRPTAERFTLASLQLQPGTVVMHNGIGKFWDGTALVTGERDHPAGAEFIQQRPERVAWVRWLLAANALLLAIIAMLVSVRRWRGS